MVIISKPSTSLCYFSNNHSSSYCLYHYKKTATSLNMQCKCLMEHTNWVVFSHAISSTLVLSSFIPCHGELINKVQMCSMNDLFALFKVLDLCICRSKICLDKFMFMFGDHYPLLGGHNLQILSLHVICLQLVDGARSFLHLVV